MATVKTVGTITISVSENSLARMRKLAEWDEELKSKTDQELIEWMEESIQNEFSNGNLLADQFDF